MRQGLRRAAWAWGLALATAGIAHAAPPPQETRVFRVNVDQKPAGEYRMDIRQEGDNATMTATADVKVRIFLASYVYTYRGSEVWKGDRLARFDSNTVDDKKHLSVTAWAEGTALNVRANGQERLASPDVWVTTYWRLPAAKFRNQNVFLLDGDTGRDLAATLRFVGMENTPVAGQMVQCAHWRVAGAMQAELWYDGYDRLVRQETIEDGHKTVLDLIQVRR
jgi:hypothetical protein